MNIFIGTAEIAGMMHFLSSAFRRVGHSVTTCVDNSGSTFFNFNYDLYIPPRQQATSSNRIIRKLQQLNADRLQLQNRKQVFEAVKDTFDLYIFIWDSFLPSGIEDYQYLSKRGKKIVSIFLGSDVRHVSAFAQEYNLDITTWEQWFHTTPLNNQMFRLRKAELFSNAIFSLPDQSGLAIRPYYKMYIPFDMSNCRFIVPARSCPKIVHIPSRTGIKGTNHILNTIEELKNEGLKFEFELITGVTNSVVLEKLTDADILIDELYLHGPGTLSLEGVSSGCAVATKTAEGEPYDAVLCNVNLDNLKSRIKRLIVDLDYRLNLVRSAYQLVRELNSPIRIAEDILQKAFSPESIAPEYIPSFFANSYKLPTGAKVNKTNLKLTRQVISNYQLEKQLDIRRMKEEHLY